MMKNRFFMLGLGIGLIAGALLLQLMIAGRGAPLTKEELIRQAASLNLTVVDPAETAATATPSPEEGAQAKASGAPATTPATPASTPVVPPKPAVVPSAAATPGKPSAPAQPQSTASPVTKAPATPEAPVAAVEG